MISVPKDKSAWRQMSRTNRRSISEKIAGSAGEAFAEIILSEIEIAANAVVAGYWPMLSEADVVPTLTKLHETGRCCVLPTTGERHSPLIFRQWRPGDELQASDFGVMEPTADKPAHIPDIMLAPLLAFDANGNRLGYGGGHYDQTVASYKKDRGKDSVTVIGIAFSGQQVDALPNEKHDQRLDLVVTETGIVRFE